MYNGAGTYTPPNPEYPTVDGTAIYAADFNAIISDIADALSMCVTADGQQTITANLPMNGFVFTGLGAGSAVGQSVRYEQIFPTLITGTVILADVLTTAEDSTKVPTTAWVQDRIVEPIYKATVIPTTDYSQQLATTAYVTDKFAGPVGIPAINLYKFDNLN